MSNKARVILRELGRSTGEGLYFALGDDIFTEKELKAGPKVINVNTSTGEHLKVTFEWKEESYLVSGGRIIPPKVENVKNVE